MKNSEEYWAGLPKQPQLFLFKCAKVGFSEFVAKQRKSFVLVFQILTFWDQLLPPQLKNIGSKLRTLKRRPVQAYFGICVKVRGKRR